MMAGNMIRATYTGDELRERRVINYPSGHAEEREIILPDVTHLEVRPNITIIPEYEFNEHPNLVELICHENVVKIEEYTFSNCPRLRGLSMRGIIEVQRGAFNGCESLEYVECDELEFIGEWAFYLCKSLAGINLPSARIVEDGAFEGCVAIKKAKFGTNLESVGHDAFQRCSSLEQITIPLKNDLFPCNSSFLGCCNLSRVTLVEEDVVHATVNALLRDEWKNDMNTVIDSIKRNLPNARPGDDYVITYDEGEKTIVIRSWISSVLSKIIDYKAQHRQILNEAASTLEHLLPKDIVLNNVLSFIELPLHTFDGEDDEGLEG